MPELYGINNHIYYKTVLNQYYQAIRDEDSHKKNGFHYQIPDEGGFWGTWINLVGFWRQHKRATIYFDIGGG